MEMDSWTLEIIINIKTTCKFKTMKKLILIVLATLTIQIANAQKKQKNNFTTEQKAWIQTKKLTLALDLTDSQEKKIFPLEMQIISNKEMRKKVRENPETKNLTPDDKYNKIIKNLNDRIAIKRQLKQILDSEQFEKWEKMHQKHHRRKKMLQRKHAKHSKQNNPE